MRKKTLAIALAVVLVIMGGCGKDKKQNTTPAPTAGGSVKTITATPTVSGDQNSQTENKGTEKTDDTEKKDDDTKTSDSGDNKSSDTEKKDDESSEKKDEEKTSEDEEESSDEENEEEDDEEKDIYDDRINITADDAVDELYEIFGYEDAATGDEYNFNCFSNEYIDDVLYYVISWTSTYEDENGEFHEGAYEDENGEFHGVEEILLVNAVNGAVYDAIEVDGGYALGDSETE